jgi:hypothetical protein
VAAAAYARFRIQVERVIAGARLTEADREWALRAVEDHRRRGTPLPRLHDDRKAEKVAAYLCSVLAYMDVELPERVGDLERMIFDRLSGEALSKRRRQVITRRTVALAAVAAALLFAAAGAIPELLGDWPYNAFGNNSRAHPAHHRPSPAASGLPRRDRA